MRHKRGETCKIAVAAAAAVAVNVARRSHGYRKSILAAVSCEFRSKYAITKVCLDQYPLNPAAAHSPAMVQGRTQEWGDEGWIYGNTNFSNIELPGKSLLLYAEK